MGMIESIRNRQTLLLTLIGLGMLSFLIPYDAVIALMGNNAGNQSAGVVNGKRSLSSSTGPGSSNAPACSITPTTGPPRMRSGAISSRSACTAASSAISASS